LPAIDAARLFGTVGVAFALAVDRTIADMGGHVFISYSRTDRGYVVDLAKQLDATGIEVWYDFELAVGERFDATIQHKIDTCAAFIVVLTRDAAASEWVVREIAYAQHRNKPVLPLLLSSCDLPITLIRVHHEDVTSGQMPDARFLDQLRAYTRASGSSEQPSPAGSPRRAGNAAGGGILVRPTSPLSGDEAGSTLDNDLSAASLEAGFQAACDAAVQACRKLTPPYRPTAWISMASKWGAAEAARRLVITGDIQTGFERLVQAGRPELTIEWAILDPKWRPLFTDQHREAAAWRLRQAHRGDREFLLRLRLRRTVAVPTT
jgi:hypothetical protein